MTERHPKTLGALLAGGLARRMGGGDKALRTIGGRTILERVLERFAPQCDGLILNANGDPARFAALDLPVVADTITGFAGPLAGILAALEWAAEHRPDCEWVASIAADTPFLPGDLVARLHEAREALNVPLACACSGVICCSRSSFRVSVSISSSVVSCASQSASISRPSASSCATIFGRNSRQCRVDP